eukprot:18776-Heterococcus_DN1.PRE.1
MQGSAGAASSYSSLDRALHTTRYAAAAADNSTALKRWGLLRSQILHAPGTSVDAEAAAAAVLGAEKQARRKRFPIAVLQ